jgi:hypothetical protein
MYIIQDIIFIHKTTLKDRARCLTLPSWVIWWTILIDSIIC